MSISPPPPPTENSRRERLAAALPQGHLYISRAQFAAKLGVNVRTLDRMRADGLLPRPARVLRGRSYWLLSQADAWMAAGRAAA